jgi:uncharacterized membrane protein (UPF0127 family)
LNWVKVVRLKDQAVIAEKCFEAVHFWDRLRGLIGKDGLTEGEAMWFPRCSSVHTFWMRFPIDVVFLRRSKERQGTWVVSSVRQRVSPWRVALVDLCASDVLELAGGVSDSKGLLPGDEVECIG